MNSTHHGCSSYRGKCRRDEERPGPNNCRKKQQIFLKTEKSLSGRNPHDADDYLSDIEKADHGDVMSECHNGLDEA